MTDPLALPNRHYTAGYGRGVADQKAEQNALLRRCFDVLQLPLIFHSGGEVTLQMRNHWKRLTGVDEITNKVMCDVLREMIRELQCIYHVHHRENGDESWH